MGSLLKKYKFDSVIHFAAESHVDRSIDGPEKFVNTNIFGTLNLLEHSKYYKNKNTTFGLHISTDEAKDLGDIEKFVGIHLMILARLISIKSRFRSSCQSWNKTYALPTLITNCSNNYGPYQFPEN